MNTIDDNICRIFVSFGTICLDNLPAGSFRHRLISADEAKRLINQARERNALLCLSDDDLLAPYRKHQRENHEALCRVLSRDQGINLGFKDFCSRTGDAADALYTVNPLSCMQVRGQNRLLIATCNYALPENRTTSPPAFEIAPESITFHLVEAIQADAPPPTEAAAADPLLGSMREDAELLDQIVTDVMRHRQIQAWRPSQEDFDALEAIAQAKGQTIQEVLNDAVRHFTSRENANG